MNAQVFMEAMGQVDARYVEEVLYVKLPHYKRVYITAVAFIVVIAVVVALCIGSIARNPEITEHIQISRLTEYLGKNYSFDLTAEVGDEIYELKKNTAFAQVLAPNSWVETEEKAELEDPLLILNFGSAIHYTFYPDGYVYALYSGELRSSYVPIKKDTQYQAPAELPRKLLEYILQNGTEPVEESDPGPILTAEECVVRALPLLDAEFIESVEVLSQELITWAQYTEKYEELSSYEADEMVWVFTLRDLDRSGNVTTKLVVANATTGFPVEIMDVEE